MVTKLLRFRFWYAIGYHSAICRTTEPSLLILCSGHLYVCAEP